MPDQPPANEELKIVCIEDCGNAPRKKILLDFIVAYAKGDLDAILEQVADTISWNRVGDKEIQGKDRLIEVLTQMKDFYATELRIENIITHGYTAAMNGIIIFEEKHYSFCNVYKFNGTSKSAKIKEISTYAIDIS